MPLSDELIRNFTNILQKILNVAAEKASKLTNSTMSVAVNKHGESFIKDSRMQVSEASALVTIENTINSVDPILVLTDVKAAALVADKMMGQANEESEFSEDKHEAYVNAIVQSAKASLESFTELTTAGLQLTESKLIIVDPQDDESMNLAVDPDRYKFELSLDVDGTASSVYLDISSQNVNTLLSLFEVTTANQRAGASGASSASQEQETVGDFMGTDFGEIIDSHNPNDIDPAKNLNLLMDIRLGLIVELGRAEMHLKDILKLTKGSIIELDRLSGEPVDLFVNNKLIARGEVVVIDDNFGLRINQLAGNTKKDKKMLSGAQD